MRTQRASLLCILLIILSLIYTGTEAAAQRQDEPGPTHLAILEAVNTTDIKSMDWLPKGVLELLSYNLSYMKGIVQVPIERHDVSGGLEILNTLQNMNVPESVTISRPKNDIKLDCDSRKIEAVLSNLITNSIQAMNNSGDIQIKLEETLDENIIKIQDSGPGIPKEILPKIFEPLFTSKEFGTGLGLGICKSIIEQHNGEISVSQNPTTFVINLPKAKSSKQ